MLGCRVDIVEGNVRYQNEVYRDRAVALLDILRENSPDITLQNLGEQQETKPEDVLAWETVRTGFINVMTRGCVLCAWASVSQSRVTNSGITDALQRRWLVICKAGHCPSTATMRIQSLVCNPDRYFDTVCDLRDELMAREWELNLKLAAMRK